MKHRILAVDDENIILHLLARFLKGPRYELTTCSGVAESFRRMDEGEFELLITDLRLADGIGTDVAKHFKKKFPDGHVIVMTGLLMPQEYLKDISDLFPYQIVYKPFDLATIQSAIEKVFPSK